MGNKRKRKKRTKKNRPVQANQNANKCRLSLCMIVKDEEHHLPRCLTSVQNIVDEIIVVDTGSTDKTTEIAKQFGAKIYQHPWENNFAKHRNQSIQYASGNWVLILDADEEIIPPTGNILKTAIIDETIDSIAVQVINAFNQGIGRAIFNSVRLFRTDAGIKYEGIVHNKEVGCTKTKFFPVQILHHGYDFDEQKTKEKFERTATLLKRQIDDNPQNPLPHHYLAASYMSLGPYDTAYYLKAVEEGELAISLAFDRQDKDPIYVHTHYIIAASYLNLGNPSQAENICRQALRIFSQHLDSYYLLAKINDQLGKNETARVFADQFLIIRDELEQHPERFGRIVNISYWSEWYINIIQGKSAYLRGETNLATQIFQSALNQQSAKFDAYKLIGLFYLENTEFQEAEYYLKYYTEKEKDRSCLYMLCECYGQLEKTDEQTNVLSDIISHFPDEIDNLKKIGLIQYNRSNYQLAHFCLQKVVETGNVTVEITEKLSLMDSIMH